MSSLQRQQIKVLIVEDQKEVRDVVRMSIRTMKNYQPVFREASNGIEGLNILNLGFLPDVILSDVMMPEMDGIEFCKKIKESLYWCLIPFIYLTAKIEISSFEEGIEAGAIAYIRKPFQPRELCSLVERQIQLSSQNQELLSQTFQATLGVFSHETGTTLNGILGFSRLLRDVAPLENDHQVWLENIISSAERLNKLRLKSISLISLLQIRKLHLQKYNLNIIFSETISSYKDEFQTKSIVVEKNFDQNCPKVLLKIELIKEMLEYLLDNVVKFGAENSILCCNIQIRDSFVVLLISDQGEGI
ncbi:MAG: CheY-like chemotaxis protein, partial [bacterium]